METEYTDLHFLHNPKGLPTLKDISTAIDRLSNVNAGKPRPTPLNKAKINLYERLIELEFYLRYNRADFAYSALINVRNAHAALVQVEEIMYATK